MPLQKYYWFDICHNLLGETNSYCEGMSLYENDWVTCDYHENGKYKKTIQNQEFTTK